MIRDHEKLQLPDESGKNHLTIEVNWNPEDPKTNECKIIKLTYPDKKTAYVKREHLHAFLFAIGTAEQQKDLVPTTLQRMRWYETIITVKAHKDVKKGGELTFPIKLSLPTTEEEIIGKKKFGGSSLVKPPLGVIRR